MNLSGKVIEEQKNYYIVSTQQGNMRCTLKGTLLKNRTRICTGDSVCVQVINADNAEGIINETHKRQNFMPRPPLANLSQVIFVNCFKRPPLNTEAVDRFLFTAAVYEINAVIVFNKMDLLDKDETRELEEIVRYYKDTDYKFMYTSVPEKQGIAELIELCRGKTSAFTGLSGVGKSSLLSLIFPNIKFNTSEVSGTNGRGIHTTTHTKLLQFNGNTFIADTPGFAFVDVPTVPENTVATYFPELERLTGDCRFNNCIHDAEPGCRVIELIKSDEIAPWRREHYLKIYNEMVKRRKLYV